MKLRTTLLASALVVGLAGILPAALAQQSVQHSEQHGAQAVALQLRFSCSQTVGSGEQQVIYADSGEFALQGEQILGFRWESSLHRRTHGFDCSIDQDDGLQAGLIEQGWRISLRDGPAARQKRGYDTGRGQQCSVRLLREGDALQELHVIPTCALLCGSRENFSELRINLRDGTCQYE